MGDTVSLPDPPSDRMHYDPTEYRERAVCLIWKCGHLVEDSDEEYCGECGYPRYD